MEAPRAGVTLNWYRNEERKAAAYGRWLFGLNQSYVKLLGSKNIQAMGLLPTSDDFAAILKDIHMLVMTGGGDPDPQLYGEGNNGSVKCYRERPIWEMGLYREARRKGLPILGICLGMQLIAMAEGSQLIQNIPTQVQNPLHHHGTPHRPESHSVALVEGTRLHGIFGDSIDVSSFHHQAVRQLPRGFRAAAFAPDGVMEAFESEDGLVLAVQWHPERDFTGSLILKMILDDLEGRA